MRFTLTAVLALLIVWGAAQAADEADVERLKRDAEIVGRQYADQGLQIADDAVDFANRVADNFVDAYNQSKRDAAVTTPPALDDR